MQGKELLCKEHPEETLGHYCRDCKKFICVDCECYDSHETELIHEFNKINVREVENKIKELKAKVLEADIGKIEDLKKEMDKLAKNRQERITALKQEIERMVAEGEEEHRKDKEIVEKNIELYITKASGKKEKIEELLEKLEKLGAKLKSERISKLEMIEGHEQLHKINTNVEEFDQGTLKELQAQVELLRKPTQALEKFEALLENLKINKKYSAKSLLHAVPMSSNVLVYDLSKNGVAVESIKGSENKLPFYFGVTSDNKSTLYVAGGTFDLMNPLSATFAIDTSSSGITSFKRLQTPRYQNSLAKVRNTLICIGGRSITSCFDTIETLDLDGNGEWTFTGKLPIRLCLAATAVIENGLNPCVYIYGGMYDAGDIKVSNKLFEYRATSGEINEIVMLEAPALHSAGMVAIEQVGEKLSLLIFGGNTGLDSNGISKDVYAIIEGRIKHAGRLKKPDTFYGACPVLAQGSLYAMGKSVIHKKDSQGWKALPESAWYNF